MELVIAEKPDAAEKIAEFLGCKPVDGAWKSDEFIVIAARGHLLNAWLKGLNSDKLPATEIYWRETKATREQLENIKSWFNFHVGKLENIIIATDNDREGEVIGERIYAYLAGNLKKIYIPEKRWYFSALIPSELKRGFDRIRPMDETQLAQGHARNMADTIIGLNLTKALTRIFKANFPNLTQGISLGRVQSPLLKYISEESGITIRDKPQESTRTESETECLINFNDFCVEVKCENVEGKDSVELIEFKEEERTRKQAEKFPNTDDVLSALPFSPEVSMNILESLYLQGYITYPRTKSHYVPLDFAEELEKALKQHVGMRDTFNISHMVQVKKDESKMAIVPTPQGVEAYTKEGLSTAERSVLGWLIARAIRGFAPPLKFKVKVAVFDGFEMEWRTECLNPHDAIKYISEKNYPEVQPGEYPILRIERKWERYTISEAYTTFISKSDDRDLVSWMTIYGLGTEATRHTYPGLLRQRNYTNEENMPTKLGNIVARIIKSIGLDEYLTARMEDRIAEIERLDELEEFKNYVVEITQEFIEALEQNSWNIELYCPKGHRAGLRNTKFGLLIHCEQCGKFYPV